MRKRLAGSILITTVFVSCLSKGAAPANQAQTMAAARQPNDTAALQSLLDSPENEIAIPKKDGPWFTEPLFLRAKNKRIILEPGCEIAALPGAFQGRGDCLLTLENCADVTVTGYGARLSMRRGDYAREPYAKGEWRHGISLNECANVTIEGLEVSGSGGDGVYLGHRGDGLNTGITLRNLTLAGNYRQGVSVIAAERFLMEGCTVTGTKGTAPSAGIDFEPNTGTGGFTDCVLRNCRFEGNAGPGILVYPIKLAGSGNTVDIRVENCVSRKNLLSVSIYGVPKDTTGGIAFIDCDLSFAKLVRAGKNLKITFQ